MPLTAAQARKIALSFPGTTERWSQGGPVVEIDGAYFVRIGTRDPDTVQFKLESFEERDAMIAAQPKLFFITDHWRSYRGLLARLATLDAKTLRALLAQRLAAVAKIPAPKRRTTKRAKS
jgi:hypothetical protein